jgi:hypothetical protein
VDCHDVINIKKIQLYRKTQYNIRVMLNGVFGPVLNILKKKIKDKINVDKITFSVQLRPGGDKNYLMSELTHKSD